MMWANLLAQNQTDLSAAGWTVMICCVGTVCGLVVFCFRRVLGESSSSEHGGAQRETEPHDVDG